MRLVSAFVTSDRIALTAKANCMFLRLDTWAIPARVYLRELRAQKANQRRVIDPEQQDYQRTRRSKRIGRCGSSEINTDGVFSCCKKQCCHRRPDPDVFPRDHDVRQKFVDHGKESRDHEERADNVCRLPNPRDAWQPVIHISLKRADDCADYERNEEEKSHTNGDRKRTYSIDNERHDHATI